MIFLAWFIDAVYWYIYSYISFIIIDSIHGVIFIFIFQFSDDVNWINETGQIKDFYSPNSNFRMTYSNALLRLPRDLVKIFRKYEQDKKKEINAYWSTVFNKTCITE